MTKPRVFGQHVQHVMHYLLDANYDEFVLKVKFLDRLA